MATEEIDEYLAGLDEAKRSALADLRATLADLLPDAEQGLSYGMPAFKVGGKAVAGFAAFARHLSYFPHSGSVVSELAEELAGYATSKGTIKFPIDQPLPPALVARLVEARRAELNR